MPEIAPAYNAAAHQFQSAGRHMDAVDSCLVKARQEPMASVRALHLANARRAFDAGMRDVVAGQATIGAEPWDHRAAIVYAGAGAEIDMQDIIDASPVHGLVVPYRGLLQGPTSIPAMIDYAASAALHNGRVAAAQIRR